LTDNNTILHQNIVVMPVKNSCNSFHVFYYLFDYNVQYTHNKFYYRKLSICNNNDVNMTEPEILHNITIEGCDNGRNLSIMATEYNQTTEDNLLIISLFDDVYIRSIGEEISDDYKLLEDLFQGFDAVYRNNNVLTYKDNGDVVIVIPEGGAFYNLMLRYVSFPRDYAAIDNINHTNIETYEIIHGSNNDKINGIKVSPNGSNLYTTQTSVSGFQCYDIGNYLAGSSSPPDTYTTVGQGNFEKSELLLGRDGKIYAIEEVVEGQEVQTYLASIDDPNNPSSTTISHQLFGVNGFKLHTFPDWSSYAMYHFPYQMDWSDYSTYYPPVNYSPQPDWSTIGSTETWTP
jgi:hypothetical protein